MHKLHALCRVESVCCCSLRTLSTFLILSTLPVLLPEVEELRIYPLCLRTNSIFLHFRYSNVRIAYFTQLCFRTLSTFLHFRYSNGKIQTGSDAHLVSSHFVHYLLRVEFDFLEENAQRQREGHGKFWWLCISVFLHTARHTCSCSWWSVFSLDLEQCLDLDWMVSNSVVSLEL